MMDAAAAVSNIIRSSEKVKVVIDTYPGSGSRSSSVVTSSRGSSIQSTRRVIAVITREEKGRERGGYV